MALARLYLIVLGAGLLLEGAVLLVLDRVGTPLPITTSDLLHNVLHVTWGAALLAVGVVVSDERRVVQATLIFGTFYVALGVLGLTLARPLGMQLGPAENAFHFIVGPLALLFGVVALRSQLRNVARPVAVRNGRAARPPARRRHGIGRAGRRRR